MSYVVYVNCSYINLWFLQFPYILPRFFFLCPTKLESLTLTIVSLFQCVKFFITWSFYDSSLTEWPTDKIGQRINIPFKKASKNSFVGRSLEKLKSLLCSLMCILCDWEHWYHNTSCATGWCNQIGTVWHFLRSYNFWTNDHISILKTPTRSY